ncbi:hypothetical protein SESBI_45010 [Sesbania bispinosa]|nr:hypothetical protein SESBI_45010 [Sesbania bispinosa]
MVTRRNTGRADGHAGNGDDTSETTPETDNPVLQRILRRMNQLQEQNQTLQEQNQTLQTQVTTLERDGPRRIYQKRIRGNFTRSRRQLLRPLTLSTSGNPSERLRWDHRPPSTCNGFQNTDVEARYRRRDPVQTIFGNVIRNHFNLVLAPTPSFHIRHIRPGEEISGSILSPEVEDDDLREAL